MQGHATRKPHGLAKPSVGPALLVDGVAGLVQHSHECAEKLPSSYRVVIRTSPVDPPQNGCRLTSRRPRLKSKPTACMSCSPTRRCASIGNGPSKGRIAGRKDCRSPGLPGSAPAALLEDQRRAGRSWIGAGRDRSCRAEHRRPTGRALRLLLAPIWRCRLENFGQFGPQAGKVGVPPGLPPRHLGSGHRAGIRFDEIAGHGSGMQKDPLHFAQVRPLPIVKESFALAGLFQQVPVRRSGERSCASPLRVAS